MLANQTEPGLCWWMLGRMMADSVIITLGTLELLSKVNYQSTECHKQKHVLVSVRMVQVLASW